MDSPVGIRGWGYAILRGPDGRVKLVVPFRNLITSRGDELYAKRGHGTADTLPTGMRLGTGATAASKSGAGAAIVTYVTASQRAFEATFPSVADKAGADDGWRIAYKCLWAAGVATASGIQEAVVTNENPLTDVAGAVANTISRAILSPVVNKGASDTLEITWNHDFLGA